MAGIRVVDKLDAIFFSKKGNLPPKKKGISRKIVDRGMPPPAEGGPHAHYVEEQFRIREDERKRIEKTGKANPEDHLVKEYLLHLLLLNGKATFERLCREANLSEKAAKAVTALFKQHGLVKITKNSKGTDVITLKAVGVSLESLLASNDNSKLFPSIATAS